jgi:hypothetical protein
MVAPTSGVPPPGVTFCKLACIAASCVESLRAIGTLGIEFTPQLSSLLK